MSNAFYQGAEVYMSSGWDGANMAQLSRVQSVNFGYNISRSNIPVLGKMRPLANRPVINYTPVPVSLEYVKGDKDFERNVGILNPTGVGFSIGNSMDIVNYGARNLQVKLAPAGSQNYAGQINLYSGVLNSFSMQGDVGNPVKCSASFEFLDLQQVANNSVRTINEYPANIIKSENVTLTGIDYSGFGLSGIVLQSFRLDIAFSRTASYRMGFKYPERRVTEVNASLALRGFLEGINTGIQSLSQYDCGAPISGVYSFGLQSSCSSEAPTNITITNPYIEAVQFGAQVGNFISVDLTLSAPLSTIPQEMGFGTNLTIV